MKILEKKISLSNGVEIPAMGFGTYRLNDKQADEVPAIKHAINVGYKMFDLAIYYKNHHNMVQAMQETNTNRDDLFLVSKVWNPVRNMGYEEATAELHRINQELQIKKIDLVLLHWPCANSLAVWKAFEDFYEAGHARAIGICNFTPHQLSDFIKKVRIKPHVNQFQLSPSINRTELVNLCKAENIVIMAWRTIGAPGLLQNDVICKIAQNHNVTPAQVCLKWASQQDIVIIPKSKTPSRIEENTYLDNFALTTSEMNEIFELPQISIYWPLPNVKQDEPNW